jgi:hypothetical protein
MSQPDILNLDQDYTQKYGFHDDIQPVFQTERGLTRRVVEEISHQKNEPQWMREFRLQAYDIFISKPMPAWGPDLSRLDFDEIVYYIKPTDRQGRSWDEVPDEIKQTFDRLGIPEWERKFLAGVGAQYDCLTADAMVYTDTGLVPIAEIQARSVGLLVEIPRRGGLSSSVCAARCTRANCLCLRSRLLGARSRRPTITPSMPSSMRRARANSVGRFVPSGVTCPTCSLATTLQLYAASQMRVNRTAYLK